MLFVSRINRSDVKAVRMNQKWLTWLINFQDLTESELANQVHEKLLEDEIISDDVVAIQDVVEALTKTTDIELPTEATQPGGKVIVPAKRFDDFWETNRDKVKTSLEVRKVLKRINKWVWKTSYCHIFLIVSSYYCIISVTKLRPKNQDKAHPDLLSDW